MDGLSGYVIRKNNMGKPCGCNCNGTGAPTEDPCLNPPCNGGGDPPDDVLDTSDFPVSGAGSYHVWVKNSMITGFSPLALTETYAEGKFEFRQQSNCGGPFSQKACSAEGSGLIPVAVDGWTFLCSFSGVPKIKGNKHRAVIIDSNVTSSKTAGMYWYHLPYSMKNRAEEYGEVGSNESFSYLAPYRMRQISKSLLVDSEGGASPLAFDQYGTEIPLDIDVWETPNGGLRTQGGMWAVCNSDGSPSFIGRAPQCAAHRYDTDSVTGKPFNIYEHSGITPCRPDVSGLWNNGASIVMHNFNQPIAISGFNAPEPVSIDGKTVSCTTLSADIHAGMGYSLPIIEQIPTDNSISDNIPDRHGCVFGVFDFTRFEERKGLTNYAIGNISIIGQVPCQAMEFTVRTNKIENAVVHGWSSHVGGYHSKAKETSGRRTRIEGMEELNFALCSPDTWTSPDVYGTHFYGGDFSFGGDPWWNDGNLDGCYLIKSHHHLPPESLPAVKHDQLYATNFIAATDYRYSNQPKPPHWLGFYDCTVDLVPGDLDGDSMDFGDWTGPRWTDCVKLIDGESGDDPDDYIRDYGGSLPLIPYYSDTLRYFSAPRLVNGFVSYNSHPDGSIRNPNWAGLSYPVISGDPNVSVIRFEHLDNTHQDFLRGQNFMGGVPNRHCWGNRVLFQYGSGQLAGPNSPFYKTDVVSSVFNHFDWMTASVGEPDDTGVGFLTWPGGGPRDLGPSPGQGTTEVGFRPHPERGGTALRRAGNSTSYHYTCFGTTATSPHIANYAHYGKPDFRWRWFWGGDFGGFSNFGFSPAEFCWIPANGTSIRNPGVFNNGAYGQPVAGANDFLPLDYQDYLDKMEETDSGRGAIPQIDQNTWYPIQAISCPFHVYSSGIYSLHFLTGEDNNTVDWEPHFAVVHSDESPLEIANQLNAMTVARFDPLNLSPPQTYTYSEKDVRAQYNGTTGGACECGPGAV